MTALTLFRTAKKYLITTLLSFLALLAALMLTVAPVWADATTSHVGGLGYLQAQLIPRGTIASATLQATPGSDALQITPARVALTSFVLPTSGGAAGNSPPEVSVRSTSEPILTNSPSASTHSAFLRKLYK